MKQSTGLGGIITYSLVPLFHLLPDLILPRATPLIAASRPRWSPDLPRPLHDPTSSSTTMTSRKYHCQSYQTMAFPFSSLGSPIRDGGTASYDHDGDRWAIAYDLKAPTSMTVASSPPLPTRDHRWCPTSRSTMTHQPQAVDEPDVFFSRPTNPLHPRSPWRIINWRQLQ